MDEEKVEHWCESCGVTAMLTTEEGFQAGWDFPPRMGQWGVVSPRTCGKCGIETTVWWALIADKKSLDDLSPQQRQVVARILNEVPD